MNLLHYLYGSRSPDFFYAFKLKFVDYVLHNHFLNFFENCDLVNFEVKLPKRNSNELLRPIVEQIVDQFWLLMCQKKCYEGSYDIF